MEQDMFEKLVGLEQGVWCSRGYRIRCGHTGRLRRYQGLATSETEKRVRDFVLLHEVDV